MLRYFFSALYLFTFLFTHRSAEAIERESISLDHEHVFLQNDLGSLETSVADRLSKLKERINNREDFAEEDINRMRALFLSPRGSSSRSLTNLEGEPSCLVHNCVNVTTGQFCDSAIDLVVYHGTEPLVVQRSYLGSLQENGALGKGWTVNHFSQIKNYARENKDKKNDCFFLTEDHGGELLFIAPKAKKRGPIKPIPLSDLSYKNGVTNTSQGCISGQTNIKNTKLLNLKVFGDVKMEAGSGLKRTYSKRPKEHKRHTLRLVNERRPSSLNLDYYYNRPRHGGVLHLDKVKLRAGQKDIRGELTFEGYFWGIPDSRNTHHACKISTNDGRYVQYHLSPQNMFGFFVSSVKHSNGMNEEYLYEGSFLKEKRLPDNRYLQITYERDIEKEMQVQCLKAPAGVDSSPVALYSFKYNLFKETIVTDALGYKTIYQIDSRKRLERIDRPRSHMRDLYMSERLFWGKEDTPFETQLLARVVTTATKGEGFARTYTYDDHGNVIEDNLYGNLSGKNSVDPLFDNEKISAHNTCECYRKKYVYSQNGFNLLLEETDGIQKTNYKYAPATNLLIAKLQGDSTRYYHRSFYTYDSDAAVTKEISDDGSTADPDNLTGVTERYITYYTNSETYPAGLPIFIERKCLDLETGQEILVQSVRSTFNELGKVVHQIHYDSNGTQAFELHWEYDKRGNVTKEIDAIGRSISRCYDSNNNCIAEIGHAKDVSTQFTYDYMNRLIKEDSVYSDGVHRTLSHRYDLMGNLISTVDKNGNESMYTYDSYGRLATILCPTVLDGENKPINPKATREYDLMGNVIHEVDGRGLVTKHIYTIRSQLASTLYPDGTKEECVYHLNGMLKEKIAKNRTITRYTNDVLGRIVKTETISSSGELLATTYATYSGFHQLTETDESGVLTKFTYYPNGLLKSKTREAITITYEYDSMGRLVKTYEPTGPNAMTVYAKDYDVVGRVIEERVEDGHGTVFKRVAYAYDICDRVIQTIVYHENKAAITTTEYDAHGIPVVITDPDGNQTITRNRYDYYNGLGQRVGYKEIIDPLGNTIISISDALDRVVSVIRKDAFGEITQQQEISYDANGNRVKVTDSVIAAGIPTKDLVTHMVYNSANQLTTTYEAMGMPEQKQIYIMYNAYGQKERVLKANGVSLDYTYDALGRLLTLSSNDRTISYLYHYDLLSNPVKVEDLVSGMTIQRVYDSNHQVLQETLGNGLVMNYSYDPTGRPLTISLPDGSGIAYSYKAPFLEKVARLDVAGRELYSHQYTSYDLQGQLSSETLIGQAGKVVYNYDRLGRLTQADAAVWKESLTYDCVGNLKKQCLRDSQGEVSTAYDYDSLYQLKQEEGVTTHAYAYDSYYNRVAKDEHIYQINVLNQLVDDGVNTYRYNYVGNLKKKTSPEESVEYTYDALDRLIEMQDEKQKVLYAYDADQRRLSKTFYTKNGFGWKETQKIRFLYHGQNEIGAVDANGIITELRVLGSGKGAEIGASVAIEVGGRVYAPVHDHNGNIACLIDSVTAAVAESYRYSAFGEELFDTALTPWRFSSKRVDPESGFLYFGRRYYIPEIARWLTPDPIGREGGPNLYAYVYNSPLTHVDLYGLFMDGICSTIKSGWNTVVDCCKNYGSYILKAPGYMVEQAAFHFLPIPYVKDAVEYFGHLLQGGTTQAFYEKKEQQKSTFLYYPGHDEGHPIHRHVIYNGVCNSFEGTVKRCESMSERYGGATIYAIFNGSNGIILDLVEVFCQKVGIPTDAQRVAQEATQYLANQIPGGMLIVEAHSQGAETVHNLSADLKKMMNVTSFGPARVLHERDFRNVQNYVASCDPITMFADPFGLIKGLAKKEITYIKTRGCPFFAHNMEGKTYDGVIGVMSDIFKSKNGWVTTVK